MAYREKRYCAFCKNKRSYYIKRDLSVLDIFLCAFGSLALMALVWQDMNIKAFYFFTFAVVVAETMVRLRWRTKVICDVCGFDPILYKKDSKAAAAKVKVYLEKRQTSTDMLLKPYPKLEPVRTKKAAKAGAQKTPKNAPKNTPVKSSPRSPEVT